MTAASPAPLTAPGRFGVALTLWRTLVRSIATRVRIAGLSLLGLLAVALGLGIRLSNPADPVQASRQLVDAYGLSLLIPVVALMFGSAVLGDPAEDGTLVYLWLRPVPRWQLALAAFSASVTVTVPVALVPLLVATAISGGGGRLVAAAAAGGMLATVAYSAVFCGLGLRVRRALAWGLAYLLIWEEAVARVSHGAARASIFISARSVAAHIGGLAAPRNSVSFATGVIFPLAVTALALIFTARSLNRGEVT